MLFHQQSYYRFSRMVVSLVLISQLLGCNAGDSNSGGSTGGNLTSDAVVNVDLNGSVGDGPIIGATIDVYNDRGKMLSSVMSDVAAAYRLNIKAKGRDYPLLLKVSGGTDLVTGGVPDFQLLSVALNPSEKSININPFSTLVVKMAQSMGGVNAANVSAAKTIVTDSFAFGLDPSIVSDPITAQITESNVANIVKASEVLGEMVRRTRDALLTAGTNVSGDAVIAAIAADLVDGVLDGSGASGVHPTISAVAKVVSGQVLVEALSNSLKVGGVVATGVIDQSITVTHGAASSQLSDSVRITSGMLDQTLIALTASQVLDPGTAMQNIVSVVGGISPDASPAEVVTVLSADASTWLDNAVTLAPYASTGDIAAINQVVVFTGSVDTTTGGATGTDTTSGGTTGTDTTSGGTTGTDTTTGGTTGTDTTTGGTTGTDTTSGGTTGTDTGVAQGSIIILDNSDAVFSTVGNWPSSKFVSGYYGSDYQYSSKGDGSSTATWQFNIATTGNYAVEAQWAADPSRATDAPYTLYNNGSFVARVTKNQQIDGGQFNPLGSYNLAAGTLEVVLDNNASGYVIADAVQVTSGGTTSGGTTSGGTTSGGTTSGGTTSGGTTSGGTTSGGTTSGGTTVPGTPDPVQTGSITLQWTAPVTRADGTPLSLADIDGYRIFYGDSAGNYPNRLEVPDGTAQSATITDIPVGTYYIVMTTYDVGGRESAYSSMVAKTAP